MCRIINNEGIYNLDEELGNGRIYEIISYSKPVILDDIEIIASCYDVPRGTYYFDIQDYHLVQTDCYPGFEILDLMKKLMFNPGYAMIYTINYEGPCSYIVTIPYSTAEYDTRFIILDRKEPECRNWTDRYSDYELKNTVAVCDFVIDSRKFIAKFNKILHDIFDNNQFYLTEEFNKDYLKNGIRINAAGLLYTFKKHTDMFDKFLENPDNYIKEYRKNISKNSEPPKKWEGKKIISGSELENYFNSIRDKIIGKTIDNIFFRGSHFSHTIWDMIHEYRNGKWYWTDDEGSLEEMEKEPDYYPWKTENTKLVLDDIIILCFEDTNFEIEYWSGSLVHVDMNTLDTDKDCSWNANNNFSKNIIGHKLVDIQIHKTNEVYFMNFSHLGIERNDGDDMFEEIWFVFDNGYKLEITTDHCDYTFFSEIPPNPDAV